MTDSQNPRGRDYTADVRAALDRLRGYAADHSADLLGAIDKIGDAIDRQTGGRFAETVDRAQGFARRQVGHLGGPARPAHAATEPNPFDLDEEAPTAPGPGATAWQQPPGQAQRAAEQPRGDMQAELTAAMARLRAVAADHRDDLSGLVDKVGDFVDTQTKGRYAERIDRLQATAKTRIDQTLKGSGAPTDPGAPGASGAAGEAGPGSGS